MSLIESGIEAGRRIVKATGRLIESLAQPSAYTYRDVAMFFYGEAVRHWNTIPRPYEIQFDPGSVSPSQIQGELFAAFRQLLPPSERAYRTGNFAYYVSTRGLVVGGESVVVDLLDDEKRQVEGYGVGILKEFEQARVILLPPGFDSQRPGLLTPINAEEIGRDLMINPNLQRHFMWVQKEDRGFWKTAA